MDMMYLYVLWAHIEDQSFEGTMHIQWANSIHVCSYTHVRAPFIWDTQPAQRESCYKDCFYRQQCRGKSKRVPEAQYINPLKHANS